MIERDAGRERLPGGAESAASGMPVAAPDAPGMPVASDTPNGSAATAPTRPADSSGPSGATGGAVVPAGGVNTLRAILLGGGSPRTPDDARMTAIERRLDTLSLQLAREPRAAGDPATASAAPVRSPEEAARLAEIERRLAAHDVRLDAASAATRGGDVTLATLESLRQQVDALRKDHAALTEQIADRLREADARCRLRQLRVRTARRQELQLLRRRVYAPAGVLGGALSQPRPAVVAPTNAPVAPPPVWPVALASPRAATPAAAVVPSPAPASGPAQVARVADEKGRHAAMRRDLDLDGARHALGGSLAALWRSLATLVVVSARLADHDLRALWAWLTHDRHDQGAGRARDPRHGPFSD